MNVEIDVSNVVLKTERLIIRPWKEEDLEDLYEYAKVDGVGQMAGWLPHKDKEESKRILNSFIEERKTLAIEYGNKVIGSIGIEKYPESELKEFEEKRGREIGYALAKPYWGKGIMAEAVKEVIKYYFDILDLDFLICGHFIHNNQSKRVQEKCGFKHYKLVIGKDAYNEKVECWLSILENKRGE